MAPDADLLPVLLELRDEVSTVKATVSRIETQTIATNGRVSKGEEWMAAHDHAVALTAAEAEGAAAVRRADLAKLNWLRELILDDLLKLGVSAAGGLSLGILWSIFG